MSWQLKVLPNKSTQKEDTPRSIAILLTNNLESRKDNSKGNLRIFFIKKEIEIWPIQDQCIPEEKVWSICTTNKWSLSDLFLYLTQKSFSFFGAYPSTASSNKAYICSCFFPLLSPQRVVPLKWFLITPTSTSFIKFSVPVN